MNSDTLEHSKWQEDYLKFTASRRNFVIVGSNPVMQPADSKVCTRLWMEQDLRIRQPRFEQVLRGYMSAERLQFYTGSDYGIATQITDEMLERCVTTYGKLYGHAPKLIGNGCWVGSEGEVWKPVLKYIDGGWHF